MNGIASLNGELDVALINGYSPKPGTQFVILTAAAVSGAFATVTGDGEFSVTYNPANVVLTALGTPCEGDANNDGLVDPLDSGFVLSRFGCPVGAGDPQCDAADVNDDIVVDPLDAGFVLARFGQCE